MGNKCFFVDENLNCPHCKKKIGERALRKADRKFNREMEMKAKQEEKCEEHVKSIPVKKGQNHAKGV